MRAESAEGAIVAEALSAKRLVGRDVLTFRRLCASVGQCETAKPIEILFEMWTHEETKKINYEYINGVTLAPPGEYD